jgi:PAS domain-containing protein
VRVSATTLFAIGGVVVLLLLLLLARRAMTRRNFSRRVSALSARVGDPELGVEARGMEASLGHLERLVDETVARSGEQRLSVDRMEQAIGALSQGVVICDEQAEIVFRNASAVELLGEEAGSSWWTTCPTASASTPSAGTSLPTSPTS